MLLFSPLFSYGRPPRRRLCPAPAKARHRPTLDMRARRLHLPPGIPHRRATPAILPPSLRGESCTSQIHDHKTTGEKKEDQKFGEIESPCTAENSDATQPKEKVKAKEELGGVDNWCTIERVTLKTKEKPKDVDNWCTIEIPRRKEKEKKQKEEKEIEKEEKKKTPKKPKKPKDNAHGFIDTQGHDILCLLLAPNLTWEEVIVTVLHMVRC
ncbi:hypothetical protein HU200_017765 [Digitaria exilis]|uniref:Uncharacterized protein n=1 Tax=Digitaria exilis TaxID=1010633 RepID=A0A835F5Z9_9POAL|nr:hypothetical protein HU200_017765 [Digitaria exilis]CAB3450748.1 unnamed protein product [Digitaria exilis]